MREEAGERDTGRSQGEEKGEDIKQGRREWRKEEKNECPGTEYLVSGGDRPSRTTQEGKRMKGQVGTGNG